MEWFGESKDPRRKQRSADSVHYRILEYQKLRFFWSDFGLSPLELDKIEMEMPGWAEDMMTIGAARSSSDAARTQSETFEPRAPLSMGTTAKGLGGSGKQVIRRKLM